MKTLEELRREIDAIDDQLHDLLMARTEIVEGVRAAKKGEKIKIRPAREAEIVYRLLARHKGAFPKRELVRIWREIIIATLSAEGPFSTGVYTSENNDADGFWDIARDHFGSYSPMTAYSSTRRLVEVVGNQEVTVGVLPIPVRGDEKPWWRRLANTNEGTPRIIARLPFVGPGNARSVEQQALVICPVPQEPTGSDRTYLAFESTGELKPAAFERAVEAAGLKMISAFDWSDPSRPQIWLKLVEVDGFVTEDDERLGRINDTLDGAIGRIIGLGGYALPLNESALDKAQP